VNLDSLAQWRLLTASSPDQERCQSALLSILEASSYNFDADPTATSADLEALEEGASLLLSVQSPAAKAMARNIHVGVEVFSTDLNCCGIFNAKDVRVRIDPVVRMCGLFPPRERAVVPIPPMVFTSWISRGLVCSSKPLLSPRPLRKLSSPYLI
jgi:hypothetical protein